VILNNGNEPKEVSLSVKGKYSDLLNNNESFSSEKELRVTVPGKWEGYFVLIPHRPGSEIPPKLSE